MDMDYRTILCTINIKKEKKTGIIALRVIISLKELGTNRIPDMRD